MVPIYSNQKSSLGKFGSVWQKNVAKFMTFWSNMYYCHFVYFMVTWYILLSFWYIFPVFTCFAMKNLATMRLRPTFVFVQSLCVFVLKM
jgi:hypothetical protein